MGSGVSVSRGKAVSEDQEEHGDGEDLHKGEAGVLVLGVGSDFLPSIRSVLAVVTSRQGINLLLNLNLLCLFFFYVVLDVGNPLLNEWYM